MTDISEDDDGWAYTRRNWITFAVIAVAGFLGVVTIGVYSWQAPTQACFLRQAAVSLAVAGASLMLGGLAGFLFGIPRRLQREATTKPDAALSQEQRTLYEGNTNLEQISDWFTKILVGIGLVQFDKITESLATYGDDIAKALGNGNSSVFAIALMLYFFVCGFLTGYLWARLFLGRALTEAETRVLRKKLNKLERQAQADALAIALARRQISGEGNDQPDMEALAQALVAASDETKSHLFYQAESNRWKNWEHDKDRMQRSIPIFRALASSDPSDKYHRNLGQLAYALKDQSEPKWQEAENLFTRAIQSRGDAHSAGWAAYEANRAICRIKMGGASPRDLVHQLKRVTPSFRISRLPPKILGSGNG